MPIAAAAVPALIGAAGSVAGGLLGGSSAKGASHHQEVVAQAAGDNLQNLANNSYADQKSELNPYLQAGSQGVNSLAEAYAPGGDLTKQFSFDPTQIANNPNYQFMLQQGLDATQKSAAAKGSLFSGGTLKALTQYSQGLASNAINDAYNQSLTTFQTNRNNQFQGLTALTGIGQNAANQNQAALNSRFAGTTQATNDYIGGANAGAAGTLANGSAWQNAIAGITNNAQTYFYGNPIGGSKPLAPGGVFAGTDTTGV